jgi:hypothetical protein
MRENIIYVALTGLLLSSLMYSFGYFRGKNLVITSTECAPCHAWCEGGVEIRSY